jgi:hypothetical protein
VKLVGYRIFDPTAAPLLGKTPMGPNPRDRKSQIAGRAYEIYEERGRHDGQADQDWLEAERETQKDEAEHAKPAPTSS